MFHSGGGDIKVKGLLLHPLTRYSPVDSSIHRRDAFFENTEAKSRCVCTWRLSAVGQFIEFGRGKPPGLDTLRRPN
jgi:hypothetical protein